MNGLRGPTGEEYGGERAVVRGQKRSKKMEEEYSQ